MPGSSTTTSGSSGPGSDPGSLDAADREALLAVARAAVRAAALRTPPAPLPADLPARLQVPAGAFVTLHAPDGLRGCVGSVAPQGTLAELVARMAAAAATRDPRFSAVTPEELAELHIDVSVLSPARRVAPDDVDPRVHGVALRLGGRGAVLLPQVAERLGWDRTTLLTELCAKARLPRDAWRDPAVELFAFTVETVEGAM